MNVYIVNRRYCIAGKEYEEMFACSTYEKALEVRSEIVLSLATGDLHNGVFKGITADDQCKDDYIVLVNKNYPEKETESLHISQLVLDGAVRIIM